MVNRGAVIASLLLVAVLIATYLLWQSDGFQSPGFEPRPNANNAVVKNTESPAGAPALPRVDLWSDGYSKFGFHEHRAELAARWGADHPIVASYTLDWTHECRGGDSVSREEGPDGVRRSLRILQKFCEGVVPLNDEEEVRLYKETVQVKFANDLVAVEKNNGIDAALDFAERFVKDAKDPYSLKAGLDQLNRAGVLDPDLDGKQKNPRRIHELYRMARDGFICEQFGACSAESIVSVRFCIATGCAVLKDYQSQVDSQLSKADAVTYRWYISSMRAIAK